MICAGTTSRCPVLDHIPDRFGIDSYQPLISWSGRSSAILSICVVGALLRFYRPRATCLEVVGYSSEGEKPAAKVSNNKPWEGPNGSSHLFVWPFPQCGLVFWPEGSSNTATAFTPHRACLAPRLLLVARFCQHLR